MKKVGKEALENETQAIYQKKTVLIGLDIEDVEVCLDIPRILKFHGFNKKSNKEMIWHLNITNNGKLSLM